MNICGEHFEREFRHRGSIGHCGHCPDLYPVGISECRPARRAVRPTVPLRAAAVRSTVSLNPQDLTCKGIIALVFGWGYGAPMCWQFAPGQVKQGS